MNDAQTASTREVARLESEVARLSSPQINAPVLEIFPESLTLRSDRGTTNEIAIPPGAASITLMLNAQSAAKAPGYALEILDAKDRIVWRTSGLFLHDTGDYTISLPTTLLRARVYRIRVYAQRGTQQTLADEYRIQVR